MKNLETNKLQWDQHINNITAKANKTLGFLRRNLKIPSIGIKEQANQTLVRPLVEYASTVWNPYTKTEINKIEAVQRRAARYVVNNQRNRSNVSNMHQTQMETFGKQEKRCKTDDDVQN